MISAKQLLKTTVLGTGLVCLIASSAISVEAKEWTVAERQAKLMQDINTAQKNNDLTAKEAKKLRSRLADVCRMKRKKKDKADGVITEDARIDLEKDLNGISTDIKKLSLEKRVQKPE